MFRSTSTTSVSSIRSISAGAVVNTFTQDEFQDIQEVGQGGEATVYRAKSNFSGMVSIKLFTRTMEGTAEEARKLVKLSCHPNINKKWLCHGIHVSWQSFPSMLLGESMNSLKISDFGMTHNTSLRDSGFSYFVGSIEYMAPEMIEETIDSYETKADCYSLAISIWEIFHRKKPYYELATQNERSVLCLCNKILNGYRPELEVELAAHIEVLLKRAFNKNPQIRPEVPEFIQVCYVLSQLEAPSDQQSVRRATSVQNLNEAKHVPIIEFATVNGENYQELLKKIERFTLTRTSCILSPLKNQKIFDFHFYLLNKLEVPRIFGNFFLELINEDQYGNQLKKLKNFLEDCNKTAKVFMNSDKQILPDIRCCSLSSMFTFSQDNLNLVERSVKNHLGLFQAVFQFYEICLAGGDILLITFNPNYIESSSDVSNEFSTIMNAILLVKHSSPHPLKSRLINGITRPTVTIEEQWAPPSSRHILIVGDHKISAYQWKQIACNANMELMCRHTSDYPTSTFTIMGKEFRFHAYNDEHYDSQKANSRKLFKSKKFIFGSEAVRQVIIEMRCVLQLHLVCFLVNLSIPYKRDATEFIQFCKDNVFLVGIYCKKKLTRLQATEKMISIFGRLDIICEKGDDFLEHEGKMEAFVSIILKADQCQPL